ncbi:serine-rich adhesin for platelets [Bactrocera tryoni]|uniref:serine-rich adhesin for platelets n=1 Tax=Bactrocera tryoni TaxID=59916 RepID=UPI001A960683|nr:serine-rich adhesin for platelets [Bactrocera tryoni]
MSTDRTFTHQRRPPDVEEALSSMLWTPYERSWTDSSSDEDDGPDQAKRLRKSNSTYDHGIAYEPQTTTSECGEHQLCPPVAITKSSLPDNVANTMQSTPYVPFSNNFYKNMNNNDASSSHESNSIKISSNHKMTDSLRDHNFPFSYSYYGSIPCLNKSWAPLKNSTELPSYESLYTKVLVTSDRPTTDVLIPSLLVGKVDAITAINNEVIEKRTCKNNSEDSLENECPLHLSSQLNLELGRLLPPTAARAVNESSEQLENNSDNIVFSSPDKYNETQAEEIMHFGKTRSANDRSQQTEEYNATININGKKENDVDDEILEERLHMQSQLSNSSQLIAMTQAIATRLAGNTDKTTKEMDRVKIISSNGEEVNQPVFYTDCIKNSLPGSRLRTAFVNNQNSNSNNYDIRLNTESMNDGCTNSGRRMNADRANGSANLFAAPWNDKATTAERENCAHLECDHNVFHAISPEADGQAITQCASGSSYRRSVARRSRSRLSFVTLPSYSHLWKKTLRGVRTKVKRVTRSSSENIVPLDSLIPNKCLAELERLYAEFRASESALAARRTDAGEGCKSVQHSQHCLSRSQSDASREDSDTNNAHDCELLNANTIATAETVDSPNKMRFSIPAATNALFCSSTSELQVQQANIFKVLPASSTSSVFLSSSECATTGCLTSNDRPRSSSSSSDDRYSNLLHETKHGNNNGYDFDSVEKQEIKNDVVVVSAIENDKRNNNSARIAELDASATGTQPSLTIQVNSESSDKNNNSNCTTNKNCTNFHSSTNNCNNNNIVSVETASVNVEVGVVRKSAVKDNRISVVNCNYPSVCPVNNESACRKSTTALNKVGSGVSEVSALPNIICKVENRLNNKNNNNIVNLSSAQRDCNGNEMKPVNASDSINIISISAESHSEQTNIEHSNKSTPTSLTTSESPSLISSQVNGASRQTTCMSPVTSEQSRTFTSTECQTDEILSTQLRLDRVPVSPILSRVHRRRDRRERRHLHQQLSTTYPHPHPHQFHISGQLRRPQDRHSMPPGSAPIPGITALHLQSGVHHTLGSSSTNMPAAMSALLHPMLPDLLHRHFPPPYSALPVNRCATTALTTPPPPTIVGPAPPPPGTTLLPPVISTVPMPGISPPMVSDGRFTLPLPFIRRSPSERSGKGCCGQWFAGPPLRSLIAVVALGGIACALSGAALGATSLAGPPSSHLTAALLMIGVGVVLVTVSGVAWRMTAPGGPPCLGLGSAVDFARCGRRPCGRGGGNAHGLLYPEFQHRPPPPSYQASMQEYRLRLLLLDRDRQNDIRGTSPPPTYRSYTGSLIRAPLTTTSRGAGPTGSIAGTSEFSFPPSYRSRNTTPVMICSERSVDTATSNRLLSSEDIPQQSTTQQLDSNRGNPTILTLSEPNRSVCEVSQNTEQPTHSQIRQAWTSAIVEIEASNSDGSQNYGKHFQETNKVENTNAVNSKAQKEQITIITISKSDGSSQRDLCSRDHIEILAHL